MESIEVDFQKISHQLFLINCTISQLYILCLKQNFFLKCKINNTAYLYFQNRQLGSLSFILLFSRCPFVTKQSFGMTVIFAVFRLSNSVVYYILLVVMLTFIFSIINTVGQFISFMTIIHYQRILFCFIW